ncbi:hypothetical protein IWW50_002328 [Coemansia erecta]|nr:hypothetical protein GGF43_001426 [Coemansia sp. RSA 2618]KAJ2826497.1 hypothetical protein IWW50_002328 [Coemansia erecta]
MSPGRQASYFGPQVARPGDDGDASDSDSDRDRDSGNAAHRRGSGGEAGEPEASEPMAEAHRWRTQPPLLPPRVATLVSTVSGATRLSLEITALFWEAVFDTISESGSSGRWLGSTAVHEGKLLMEAVSNILTPLSSLNPRIVSRIIGSSTAFGYSVVNRSLAATESLVEGGFTLYTRAVSMGLHAAGEYVRLIDAIFGSTDTSRVLASFVHMWQKEAMENSPEIRALLKEHGLVWFVSQVLKTIVAWICLQVVTRGRSQPYRLELVYTNIQSDRVFCPRKFISSSGEPMLAGQVSAQRTPASKSPLVLPQHGLSLAPHMDELHANLLDDDAGRHMFSRTRQRSATIDSMSAHGMAAADTSDDDGDAHMAMSDQEGSFRDVEWNRRLIEALQGLKVDRLAQQHDDDTSEASSDAGRPPSQSRTRSSIWSTLNSVREAAAKEQEAGINSPSDSDSSSSPVHATSVFPAFESAPASLVSSPQLSTTPALEYSKARRASTVTTSTMLFQDASATASVESAMGPNALDVPSIGLFPPAITPLLDFPPQLTNPQSMVQGFPRRPLLFNLARFISIASSAYGRSFMRVIGLDRGMIDARALLDAFGDDAMEPACSRLSRTGSNLSMDQDGSMSPIGLGKSPRAQPMSTYHANTACSPSSPRRHRSSRPETPSGRRSATARRSHMRRAHHGRQHVSEHPNHFCFSQHTGIPLSDLLFSSYVSPVVPGVTNAASMQASTLERKLRHKRSPSAAKGAARKHQRTEGSEMTEDQARQKAQADEARKTVPGVQVPAEVAESKGWFSGIPIVGSIYQSLPSPMSALSSVPIVPGVMSRVFGGRGAESTDTAPATTSQQSSKQRREPTPSQFRRFDKIRSRLVYRNPSIHALVHYIAVDHATCSVVLACRGTLGISDLFIDMICEYETVRLPSHAQASGNRPEFRAHSGMWHSALLLADASSEVFKEVAEALRLYPEYGLVITGHSLGGGVASLLTLLWSQPLFDYSGPSEHPATPGSLLGSPRQFAIAERFGLVTPRPIHCFSFGSPCSTNAALSYYCRGLVTSVVNTDDFVSFLSVGACMDILNISAVLGRERGVAEKVVRGYLSEQRTKIGKKLNWFDFDFSRLRAYEPDNDEQSVDSDEEPSSTKCSDSGWNCKTSQSNARRRAGSRGGTPEPDDKSKMDDWHLSLVKTLRANMDSEKLYPPGDVFVLASPGDDEVADKHLPDMKPKDAKPKGVKSEQQKTGAEEQVPVGLFYCPDVTERFTELRFTRNMIVHHLPSTYERKLSALVHESVL